MDIHKFILLLMLSQCDNRARILGLQTSYLKSVKEWMVHIKLGNKKICTGVQVSDARILTLAECIEEGIKLTEYRVVYQDGTKQKVIAEERSSNEQTFSLLKIKVSGETDNSSFAKLSDSRSPPSGYDVHLYNLGKSKNLIADDVDFVSDNKCEKNGITSNNAKGQNCIQVNVDSDTKCMVGSPIFGSKENKIILQGLLQTASDICSSSPQIMASIQPHLAWINSVIIDCGNSQIIENGKMVLDKESTTTYGATATIECSPGYKRNKKKVTCLKTGKWEKASCMIKDCGFVKNIQFGNAILDKNSTTVGATATVKCNPGYRKNQKKIVCLESGKWEKSRCKIKDCGSSLSVTNGILTFGATTAGSVASVTCNPGFYAKQLSIKCLTSGRWETPRCVKVS